MSETGQALEKFKQLWRLMTPKDRSNFIQYEIGYVLMAIAIVMHFGWAGAVFCLGVVLWYSGKS